MNQYKLSYEQGEDRDEDRDEDEDDAQQCSMGSSWMISMTKSDICISRTPSTLIYHLARSGVSNLDIVQKGLDTYQMTVL
jgi:acyl CoA:acetate/3-ketoacid CoA transferase alpha subunit